MDRSMVVVEESCNFISTLSLLNEKNRAIGLNKGTQTLPPPRISITEDSSLLRGWTGKSWQTRRKMGRERRAMN